jgi:hypothetical protein
MYKLLIKIPTRDRANHFLPLLKEYLSKATNSHTQILISIDLDDPGMNNEEMISQIRKMGVIVEKGFSRSKIDAVNRDIDIYIHNYDILLLSSDDMFPMVEGYDQIIIDEMQKAFPNMDGCLWFNDGHTKELLNTLPILSKSYYNQFRYVYHPTYLSLWADNEYTDVAKAQGKIKYIDQVIIRHEHPDWGGKMPVDALYQRNNNDWDKDKMNYLKRQARGFPA